MIAAIYNFLKTGENKEITHSEEDIESKYNKKRWSVMMAITFGYGFYYVCRLSLSVVKKPIVDAGIMDAKDLGAMGSALFFAYAFGKFFNGFLADRMNAKKFMSIGLLISAIVNLLLGFNNMFALFVILWGINGWVQSMGAAPSVVAMSNWFTNKERGTRYAIWSTSHNIGEAITFIATAAIVTAWGWRYGFILPGVIGIFAAIGIYTFLHDRPQTFGLPSIYDYKNDYCPNTKKDVSIWKSQLEVLKNPGVWLLGCASASMYIARYAVTSWGIFYLETAKGYSTIEASSIMSANPLFGILGTLIAGFVSDRIFNGSRFLPALLYGFIYFLSITLFIYNPAGNPFIDTLSMTFFGFTLGGLLVYLGGLMAIDITSKKASGAALGMIGIFSYLAAALQDMVSGHLIESAKIVVNGVAVYDFSSISILWIGSSVLSMFFTVLVWLYSKKRVKK